MLVNVYAANLRYGCSLGNDRKDESAKMNSSHECPLLRSDFRAQSRPWFQKHLAGRPPGVMYEGPWLSRNMLDCLVWPWECLS